MPLPLQRTKSINKSQERLPAHRVVDRVKRKERVMGVGRGAPGKRGVVRNTTFKFRSSIFVAQRKSNDINRYYDLEQQLNEGAYGVVYKAKHKDSGTERAVKKIEKSKWNAEENQKVVDEFSVLKGLDHPNILKMYELFEEEKHFYIVTDICKGGDLLDELEALEETGCFREDDAAVLVNQILSSINYCHRNHIVHRDLKPENVLLEQNKQLNEVKLIDFGFAVPLKPGATLSEQKGTAAYMSPQAMLEEPYSHKTDVWAVGVIAYIVLAGFNPFEGHTDQETAVLVEMGEFDFEIPEWEHISADAKDFVTKCLEYEEKDRPTAAEALEHPWIQHCRANINTDFYKHGTEACVTALNNLQKFNAQSKLKQATYTFIASQLLLKEEKETIDKLFRSMDTDSDGKLGREEVKVGYQNIFGEDLTDDDLENLFAQVDMNGDGIIEYSEFVVAAMQEEDLLTHENLKKAFNMFDYDNDGSISRNDLRQVLNFFKTGDEQESVEDHVIDKIMNQVDHDHDGLITFDEFKDIMFRTAAVPTPPATVQLLDEEDLLMEEAKQKAHLMMMSSSDDSATTSNASSRVVNARSAIQIPRRRSTAVECMMTHLSAKDAKAKLEDFDRQVIRNVSGSSNVSNLSAISGDSLQKDNDDDDDDDDDDAAPKKRPIKKKITRTKSGFMTQRADPVAIKDPNKAAAMAEAQQEPRRGRKKGTPPMPAAPTPAPTSSDGRSGRNKARDAPAKRMLQRTHTGGATKPLVEKFRQLEQRKSLEADKVQELMDNVKQMNDKEEAEREKRKSVNDEEALEAKAAIEKLKKEKRERKGKEKRSAKTSAKMSPKPPDKKNVSAPKSPVRSASPEGSKLPAPTLASSKASNNGAKLASLSPAATGTPRSPKRKSSPPPVDRSRHLSGISNATSGSELSSASFNTDTASSWQQPQKSHRPAVAAVAVESGNGEEKKNIEDESSKVKSKVKVKPSSAADQKKKQNHSSAPSKSSSNNIQDKLNAFGGGASAKPADGSATSRTTAKRLEGMGERKAGGVRDTQNLFKSNGTFSFFPSNKPLSPKSSSSGKKVPLESKLQFEAVPHPALEDDGDDSDDQEVRPPHRSSESALCKGTSTSSRKPEMATRAKTTGSGNGPTSTSSSAIPKKPEIASRAKTTSAVVPDDKLKKNKDNDKDIDTGEDPSERSLSASDFHELLSNTSRNEKQAARRNSSKGESNNNNDNNSNSNSNSNDSSSGKHLSFNNREANNSLRNRMKLFEQNIQKNKKLGIEKKIF